MRILTKRCPGFVTKLVSLTDDSRRSAEARTLSCGYGVSNIAAMMRPGLGPWSTDALNAGGRRASSSTLQLDHEPAQGVIGIGHTPVGSQLTETNAHPIATDRVAVVHNGIIENFQIKSETEQRLL
jgi:hypothetical protein